jgi:hypothetical protein
VNTVSDGLSQPALQDEQEWLSQLRGSQGDSGSGLTSGFSTVGASTLSRKSSSGGEVPPKSQTTTSSNVNPLTTAANVAVAAV